MKVSMKWLPIITSTAFLVTIVISVSLSFYNDHVTYLVPYISDTGSLSPESCIFGQMLNILWILSSLTIYIKYRQVQEIFVDHNIVDKNSLNKISLKIGLLTVFGLSIVANFQLTSVFVVHWIGAGMALGCGSLYVCLQTVMYLKITPVIGQRRTTQFRFVLSSVASMSAVIFFATAIVSYQEFKGDDYLKWKREDGGLDWHNASSVSEWICATCIILFILLFSAEFKVIQISEPEVSIDDRTVSRMHASGEMK